MRLPLLSAFALVAGVVHAYRDSSPFFMFSTSEFPISSSQLQSASSLSADVALSLSKCLTDHYIIIIQPDVQASDFSIQSRVPTLSARFKENMSWANFRLRSLVSIADVVGEIDVNTWRETLETSCDASTYIVDGEAGMSHIWDAAKLKTPVVIGVNLPSLEGLKGQERDKVLRDHDRMLGEVLKITKSYTVLYTTTPEFAHHDASGPEATRYDMASPLHMQQEALHVDLKRDMEFGELKKNKNETLPEGPLFERYQFFTPGLFMGFTVGLILLMILYVAISGVASLQVSYAAFDKDNGPLAARKQQ